MKLSKVTITNFRCFESLAISLQGDVNVFVGVNGAGKTAILDAIAIGLFKMVEACGGGGRNARDHQKAALRPTDLRLRSLNPNVPEAVAPPGARLNLSRADSTTISYSASDFYPLTGFPAVAENGEPNMLEWTETVKYNPPNSFSYGNWDSSQLLLFGQYLDALWPEIERNPAALIPLPVVAYYRADRRLTKMPYLGDVQSFDLDRWGAFVNALDAGGHYDEMCKWFYRRENSELREKQEKSGNPDFEYADLRAVRRAIRESVDNVDRIFFRDENVMVSLVKPMSGLSEFRLDQLSDGYKNMLGLIMDFARRLAQAHPQFKNPLEAPGMLLIDEIELHLHPKWQQTVITNLLKTFPKTQIIVTTHSPQVLTTVHSANIQILRDQKLYAAPASAYGAESQRMLEDVLGAHSRPPGNPVVDALNVLFLAISENRLDEARAKLEQLVRERGFEEPALIEADTMIKNRIWEREIGL